MNPEYTSFGKMVGLRFLRGFVTGAVSSMIMINISSVNTFADIKVFLVALAYSGLVGGITGGLLALDKAIRANGTDYES